MSRSLSGKTWYFGPTSERLMTNAREYQSGRVFNCVPIITLSSQFNTIHYEFMRDVPVYVDKSMNLTNKQMDMGSGWLLQYNGTVCPSFNHDLSQAKKKSHLKENNNWLRLFLI